MDKKCSFGSWWSIGGGSDNGVGTITQELGSVGERTGKREKPRTL